jgi:hypothetical protein
VVTRHESLSAGDYYEQIGESGALLLGKFLQKVQFVLEPDSAELTHHDFLGALALSPPPPRR